MLRGSVGNILAGENSIAGARSVLGVGPASNLQLLATRCGLNNVAPFSSSFTGAQSRIQHCLPYGAKSLLLLYSAFYVTNSNPDTETQSPGGFGWYATGATVGNAAGTTYAVGDRIAVTVATNAFPAILQVDAVSSGTVTALSVLDPGGFGTIPSANLATTHQTGSGNDALTVNLSVKACAFAMRAGIEQAWATQSAVSSSNTSGVLKVTAGANGSMGAGNIAMPFSDVVLTDPLNVELAAGALIGSRIYSPGTGFYVGRNLSQQGGLNEYASVNVTLASNNPWGGTVNSNVFTAPGFQPMAIMGVPLTPGPTFGIIGDSLGLGVVSASGSTSYDTLDANGNSGMLERAINQTYPFSNFSTGSDRITNWLSQTGATIRYRILGMLNLSHAIDQMGINDLLNGDSYTTFKAKKIAFWNRLLGLGIRNIWATTMTPNTTSTDNWATLGNQTLTSANTAIQAFNTDLRNGVFSAYVSKVIDLGTAVESAVGSGLWVASGTGDGVHPTQAQTAIVAAAIAPQIAGAILG